MRVPVSWLREFVAAPTDPATLEPALVRVGLEVEEITDLASTVTGPLVVGRVVRITELTGFKKPIRHCLVEVGEAEPRSIVCGATNFAEGDLVVVALPGAVLPGGFAIASRKTYGQLSDGMICSGRELGISEDHAGILVLPAGPRPGEDARPRVGLDDVVVELNITPDRGYCFSVRGIARELAHSLGLPFTDPASRYAPAVATERPAYPLRVEDTVGCDRYYGRLVRGTDPLAPSPEWMRRRLTQAGVRAISLAVDITNYVMLELGQPMHAFDAGALRGEVVVRRARPGERLTTLDGQERALDPGDLVIADDSGVISLAAIMGGRTTEVSDATTDVLFEAAHWDPATVARAARRHRLPSEASKRFERGVDPVLPPIAAARAVALLVEYGGGEATPEVLDIDHRRPAATITLEESLPARRAGVPYPPERVVALLAEVGCAVAPAGDRLEVTPPTWRPDLTDPADLVEEVVRLDGYDRVPSLLPLAPAGRGLTRQQRRRRTVGRALAEAGYTEALNYPFVGPADLAALGLPADDPRRAVLRLVNPISEQEPALRTSLLPPLLATLRRNVGRGQREVALFELGAVFRPRPGVTGVPPRMGVEERPTPAQLATAEGFVPEQPWHAAVVLAGDVEPAGWWGGGRPAGWADAVEAARTVLAAAGIAAGRVEVAAAEYAPWHPGRCAEIRVDGRAVGHAGELHPAVCASAELPRRTCAMELDLDAVPLAEVVAAPAISAFPPALIDVALVVGAEVPAASVQRALASGAGDLLEAVRLFDVYAGAQVGEGRKSLAYKLTFRAPDRTLTVEEAVAARDAAVAEAARAVGACLRG
ncbi:phenylalanine--tRNA ligase subunit beta [Rhizomonospora bruguierae]|uniref:phenylalanine--tRNA ligase subunit beta n=1 Tax=Rhizomonospora bruguierae TaxID=1581705 RepID=UPI001BD005B8|nr:phenylalanine--tRNA ligase subunit beta [Micromonospora sp. NBRC 107566]